MQTNFAQKRQTIALRFVHQSDGEVDDDLDVGALGEVHDLVESYDDLELNDDLIELEPKHVFC